MVGAPNFLSRTTLRPFGPRVTLTALASLFDAGLEAAAGLLVELDDLGHESYFADREDVAGVEDQQVLAVDR